MSIYEQNLLEELAEAEVVQQWRHRCSSTAAPLQSLDPAALHSLGLVRSELAHVGTIVSIVTGLANAIESGLFGHIRPHSVGSFSPTFSATFLDLLGELARQPQLSEIAQLWQALRARLALALSLRQNFISSSDQPECSVICPIEIVADSWRRVCSATLDLHSRIASEVAVGRPAFFSEREEQTLSLVRTAARGGWPCMGRDGQISIPDWAERRTEQRRTVNLNAAISIGSVKYPVILENVTTLGFGLASSMWFKPLSEVTVELPDGRCMIAYVRWAQNGKVGVRLLEPLDLNDPLLVPVG